MQIDDNLTPTDGLTNAHVRFSEMKVAASGGSATFKFDIYDEEDGYVGTFSVPVDPLPQGTVDAMIAEAHRRIRNVFRQFVYLTHKSYEAHARKAVPGSP